MSTSDEHSSSESTPDTAATEAPRPEDSAAEIDPVTTDPTTEATPKKRLASGREATTRAAGQSLGDFGGVATHRIVNDEPVKAGKKGAAAPGAEGEVEGNFDPAADMPMYRPGFDWFVLRVASNKESSVRETLLRKVQIEGMEHLVGRIMVPTEKTQSIKAGARRVTETKLYPGYVFVEMSLESDGRIPQDVFFLIKETTGVGDFVGTAGRPTPMAAHEVEKMLFDSRKPDETPQVKMEFEVGDAVTIKEGPFENYEGTVDEVLKDKGLVRVMVTIFGRQAPIELEYWQISKVVS
jgi:transcriptional antiterminator NusG